MPNIEGKVTCIIQLLEGLHPYNYPVMFQIMQGPELVTKLGQLISMEHQVHSSCRYSILHYFCFIYKSSLDAKEASIRHGEGETILL